MMKIISSYASQVFCTILCFLLFHLFVTGESHGLEVPQLEKRVNDRARMLSDSTVQQLEGMLQKLEVEESTQIALLTIDSLEGENLESYSLKVVENWQLGREDLDNGALLLIAKNDRKIRIEVGYGLEGSLTDLSAGRIIRNIITPNFKNGNFDRGVVDGISAMIGAVRGEYVGEQPAKQQGQQEEITGYIIFISFLFFTLGRIFGRNKLVGGIVGAATLPFIAKIFVGVNWPIFFIFIPVGFLAGYLSGIFFGRSRSRASRRMRSGRSRNSHNFPGSFGGGFEGGGFSGGGGGFGGGGASGGW